MIDKIIDIIIAIFLVGSLTTMVLILIWGIIMLIQIILGVPINI